MDTPITRAEHTEFDRRNDADHDRFNKRLTVLEEEFAQYQALAVSVEKLAVNMEAMLHEIQEQNGRLKVLESRDGEMWRKVAGHAVTAVIGVVIGFIFTRLGM